MSRRYLAVALALGACAGSSSPSAIGDDQIRHGTRVHPMPMRGRLMPPPTSDPAFTYYGGPVLGHTKIIEVLWGPNVAYGTDIGQFYARIAGSEYFELLAEYGTDSQAVERGSFEGLVTHPTPPSGAKVDDVTIQDELAKLLHQKVLPENDADTLYMIHFPPGTTVTQNGAESCVSFCAYHGTFERNGKMVPYAVIPDMQGGCAVGCGSGDQLSITTWVASHELAQAITDPAIGFASDASAPLAWFDPMLGELSDACTGSAKIAGFTVQTQWSRRDSNCRFGAQADAFALAVSPTAQAVGAGTSATLVVSTMATAPHVPTVTLQASGLPPGVTASFDPGEVLAGRSATLTLEAAADAPAGESDITIKGTAGSEIKTIAAHITVDSSRPGNDFTLEVTPSGRTVQRGTSTTFSAQTSVVSGGAESLALSMTGLPAGVTAAFQPASVNAGATSQVTITVGNAAAVGSALLTVTATGASATHSATVSLDVEDVPPTNDFMITMTPSLRQVTAGTPATYTVSSAVTSGSAQTIALAASGLPAGITAAFAPATITVGASSTLTLTVPEATGAVAQQSFTVTGTAASGMRTATAALTVMPAPPKNDFSVSVSPTSATVEAGAETQLTVHTSVTSGSAVPVSFAISGLPAGVTASFSPTSVTAGGSATLTIGAALDAVQGTSNLTITGSSSGTSHTATERLTVAPPPPNDFTIEISPSQQTLAAGSSTDYVVSTTLTSGDAELVELSVTGLPAGVTATFSASSVLAGASATLTLTASEEAADASKTFTVTGDAASQTHSATASVAVTSLPPPDDFSIAVTPATDSVLPGDSVTFTITTAVTSGSAQSISLGVEGLPSGVTSQINPQVVTAGNPATLTLTASLGAPAIIKSFTVSGTAASGTHVDTASLEVLPPPITELIDNGDFETGDMSYWSSDSFYAPATNVGNAHHGGARSARVGSSFTGLGDSAMYQLVDVPATGTTTLSFWVEPHCPGTAFLGDQWAVIADETVQHELKTIFEYCQSSTTWRFYQQDLTQWAGQTIAVYFYTYDSWESDTAWMYVDDVSVVNE